MENIHENQVGEVLPYQYEPEVGEKTSDVTDQSDSEQESDSYHLTRKSIMSSNQQTLGVFKL
jgi:hypothetical protein